PLRDRGRDGLEHNGKATRTLERECILVDLAGLLRGSALRLEAAEHCCRLRRQADVAHDSDAGACDRTNARERWPGAFELDDVGATFLDEADGGVGGGVVPGRGGAERHVADDQRT